MVMGRMISRDYQQIFSFKRDKCKISKYNLLLKNFKSLGTLRSTFFIYFNLNLNRK